MWRPPKRVNSGARNVLIFYRKKPRQDGPEETLTSLEVREQHTQQAMQNTPPYKKNPTRSSTPMIETAPSMYTASLKSNESYERPNVVLTACSLFSLEISETGCKNPGSPKCIFSANREDVTLDPRVGAPLEYVSQQRDPNHSSRFIPTSRAPRVPLDKPLPPIPPLPGQVKKEHKLSRRGLIASSMFSFESIALTQAQILRKFKDKLTKLASSRRES